MTAVLLVNGAAVRRTEMVKPQSHFIWFVWLFLLTPVGHAFWVAPLSLDQLTEQASLVLHGTVYCKSCQRDPAGRIYTKVQLDVAEVWKGSLTTNRFTIVHGGGILGDEQAVVSGQVEYGLGEEVVAFLVLNQRGEGVTLGLIQGKFRVWRDGKSGEPFARNALHTGEGTAQQISKAREPAASSGLTLAELRRRVQGARQ